MIRLRRVARNVTNLAAMTGFYEALGFKPVTEAANDPALAALLEVERAVSLRLLLGAQELELTQLTPTGAAYPAQAKSDDIFFQHIAIRTRDIAVMQGRALRAGAIAISRGGPQLLPKASGGVIAWKFRDPEGRPIEFLELPDERLIHDGALTSGYDHSALCVTDLGRSIGFYEILGLRLQHRHLNQGAAQGRLDGLERGLVEVVAMAPPCTPPHVELLGYPGAVEPGQVTRLNDIAADRLVFASTGNRMMLRDPDGHVVMMDGDDAEPMAS
jgi:catechol 2,3-dioxygenase-like lactoylglutathione lyase family enzyme